MRPITPGAVQLLHYMDEYVFNISLENSLYWFRLRYIQQQLFRGNGSNVVAEEIDV